jgi:hypothetical protein
MIFEPFTIQLLRRLRGHEFRGSGAQGFRGSIAAVRLSNAAAQRSRISLRSIFNPSFADFNRCPDFFIEHCEAVLEC